MTKFSGIDASLIAAFNGKSFGTGSGGGAYDPVTDTGTYTETRYTTGLLKFGGLVKGSSAGTSWRESALVVGASPVSNLSSDVNGRWLQAQESTSTDWIKIAHKVGDAIMAINSSGELYGASRSSIWGFGTTWGKNTQLSDLWTDISAGANTILGINNGKLYVLGATAYAGWGSSTYIYTNFSQVGSDTDWKQVSCGYRHSMAIKGATNKLYATGQNTNGRTGINTTSGTTYSWTECTATNMVNATNENFSTVYAEYDQSLAIQDGRAFFAGDLDNNESVGDSLTTDQSVFVQIGKVGGTFATNWVSGSVGARSSHLINSSGELYFAGEASYKIRGDDSETDAKGGSYAQIGADTDWQDVKRAISDSGDYHVAFLKNNIISYAGQHAWGQILSDSDTTSTVYRTDITALTGSTCTHMLMSTQGNSNTQGAFILGNFT